MGHFYFFCYHDDSADYPGFRLNEAARLDVMQRKEKGGGLLKRGEEGIRRERFSEGEKDEQRRSLSVFGPGMISTLFCVSQFRRFYLFLLCIYSL